MAAEKRAKKPTPSKPHKERGKENTPPPRSGTPPSEEEQGRTGGNGGSIPAFEIPAMLKGLTATTSRVVVKAATILEEEIAAGIVAAKQMEERFINVTKARSAKPDEIMQRFRKDAHEAVDIMIDLIGAASNSIDRLADTSISLGGPEPREKAESGRGGVPMLTIPHPIKAGVSATVEMMLENDQDKATDEFSFYASDLVSEKGDRIAASAVVFKPNTLRIAPRKSSKVAVSVKVPAGTLDGSYSGLVQATNLKQLKAVLVVQVQSK